MNIIVQKFGGTSVATYESRCKVIDKILENISLGNKSIVVVSAIGRKGEPYATDTLIDYAKNNNTKIESRELDLLMSCGEIISSVIIASMLNTRGYKSSALTGAQAGIITNSNYNNSEVIEVKPDNIYTLLDKGYIPVITGFQGVTKDKNITTLGRGGSDTSAVIIGESVGAKAVEIYTDVNGIMTADPKIYKNASVIDNMSYNEVFQFADNGAKVIHKRAVAAAQRANIPLIIKNTFSKEKGTNIEINKNLKFENHTVDNKIITGIAHKNNRTRIKIENQDFEDEFLFSELANNGISIDIINIFPEVKIFTIDSEYLNLLDEILNKNNIKYSYIDNCSKISIIGERITGVPGVMAKIIKCLKSKNINILQTADSLTTISCLIYKKDLNDAVCAIHKEFNL